MPFRIAKRHISVLVSALGDRGCRFRLSGTLGLTLLSHDNTCPFLSYVLFAIALHSLAVAGVLAFEVRHPPVRVVAESLTPIPLSRLVAHWHLRHDITSHPHSHDPPVGDSGAIKGATVEDSRMPDIMSRFLMMPLDKDRSARLDTHVLV